MLGKSIKALMHCASAGAVPPATAMIMAAGIVTSAHAQSPKMKMTTEIPASITIADKVETRFGTLNFEDGFPTKETAQKIYDQLDFQRAVQSVLLTTPAGSLTGFRNGIRELGPTTKRRSWGRV